MNARLATLGAWSTLLALPLLFFIQMPTDDALASSPVRPWGASCR
jgi:hypothetical protein